MLWTQGAYVPIALFGLTSDERTVEKQSRSAAAWCPRTPRRTADGLVYPPLRHPAKHRPRVARQCLSSADAPAAEKVVVVVFPPSEPPCFVRIRFYRYRIRLRLPSDSPTVLHPPHLLLKVDVADTAQMMAIIIIIIQILLLLLLSCTPYPSRGPAGCRRRWRFLQQFCSFQTFLDPLAATVIVVQTELIFGRKVVEGSFLYSCSPHTYTYNE